MAVSVVQPGYAFEEPIPVAPGREGRLIPRRLFFPLGCLAVFALTLVLDPERPTMGIELCPMKASCGLPCPGCGVTRSMIHCSRGDFGGAFRHHPLGPAVWGAAIIGASSLAWPRRVRNRLRAFWYPRRDAFDRAIIVCMPMLTLFGLLRILFVYVSPPTWWIW